MKDKKWIIWIVVAVVILGAGIGIFIAMSNKKKKEKEAAMPPPTMINNLGQAPQAVETDPYMASIRALQKYGFEENNAAEFLGFIKWYMANEKDASLPQPDNSINAALWDWQNNPAHKNKLPQWTAIQKQQWATAIKNGEFNMNY